MRNSTIQVRPPEGRECRHPLCGSKCEKKKAPTQRKPIAKVSQKRMEEIKSVGGGNELQRWFSERRREMKGFCANCKAKSCRDDDKYFKFSISHLLPKAYVKSVATHPDNWIELCFLGENSCHTQLDNGMLDMTEMNCFDEIISKFERMYPSIAVNERRRIPIVLLNYIHTDL